MNNGVSMVFSATISKVFSHWTTGGRKGRMSNGGQTLDPAITQSVLMNTYSAANHDMHSVVSRNGKYTTHNDKSNDRTEKKVKIFPRVRRK